MSAADQFFSSNRVTPYHLSRHAYVYVRQSSPKQVKNNQESQAYQYRLAERAAALGWDQSRIHIIDSDQGRSGIGVEHRVGFMDMRAEISKGGVGIILSYEVSRLSRKSSDWYSLMDLASMFGTLIADADGVYDPRIFNDRLVLGLKGTMSEAESHQMKMRLHEGLKNQVRRGTYRQRLPTGLVRRADSTVVKHPDKDVRRVLGLVFKKFEELKSCGQVLKYLRQHNIHLPRHQTSGRHKGKVCWKLPSRTAVRDIITNPAYAGAFVYGRRQSRNPGCDPGSPAITRRSQSEWLHVQQRAYQAYITWEQFEANISQISRNSTLWDERIKHAQGVVRKGAALLPGLTVCGACGRRMKVTYNRRAWYFCNARAREYGLRVCQSIQAGPVDEAVLKAFFEAVRPSQLNALEELLAKETAERAQCDGHWRARVKRARRDSEEAERQYRSVNPRNRLVAAEVEGRWEEKLIEQRSLEEAYDRFLHAPSPSGSLRPEAKETLQHLSETLPMLWESKKISRQDMKELLRCLISRVILSRPVRDTVSARIIWVSNGYQEVSAATQTQKISDLTNYEVLCRRVKQLWELGEDNEGIARQLTSEGFRSPRATTLSLSPVTVARIRYRRGWVHLRNEAYLTVTQLARRLGVLDNCIYHWLQTGKIESKYLAARKQGKKWLIKDDPTLIKVLLRRAATGRCKKEH